MTISGYWNTATSLTTSTALQSQPVDSPAPTQAQLTLNAFLNWSFADQKAYIDANGTQDASAPDPKPLLIAIGPAPTGNATDTRPRIGYSGNALTFGANKPTPAQISPDAFLTWTEASQIAFITASGGSPIFLGPNGVRAAIVSNAALTLRLGSSSGDQFSLTDPGRQATADELAATVANTTVSAFLSWRPEDRLAFVIAKGTGTPPSLTIGTGAQAVYAVATSAVSFNGGVIQRTSGDYEPIPYFYLSGSATGTPSSIVATSAEWLFPAIDGDEHTLSVAKRPAAFYTTPANLAPSAFTDDPSTANPKLTKEQKSDAAKDAFLKSFATWNTGYQLEYIKTYGTNSFTTPTVKVLDIKPSGTSPSRYTAVISPDDPTKVFVVQSLDKATVARMTLNEQNAVANAGQTSLNGSGSAFAAMKTSLGLALTGEAMLAPYGPNNNGSGYTSTPPRNPMSPIEYIRALEDEIANSPASNISSTTRLPADAQAAFTSQLSILKEQLNNSGIVSPSDIKKKVDDLRTRFNRLFAFYNVRAATAETWFYNNPDGKSDTYTVTVYADVISSDGTLNSVNRGYNVFLAQEKRIAELAEARMKLVRDDGVFNGKRLDVPYLVYKFQSLYNLSLEAQVVAETEEVNQQNDLLKTYAAIQDLINKTLSAFPKADDTKKAILGLTVVDTDKITPEQMKVLSMFEDFLSTSQKGPDGNFYGGLRNPLEVLRGVSRPTFDFFYNANKDKLDPVHDYDLNEFTHTQWSTYGTRLSETVTIINQNSQIKMNDINSLDKERNRHFELANNALAKMSDILANIARIG